METDTNPIDRSVAHLLFHRPSESPNLPAPLLPGKLYMVSGSHYVFKNYMWQFRLIYL